MGTKNINTNGTKTANWQAGEQLDAGFANINDLFQYLDLGYGVDNNTINEETLDNLYKSVTGNNSNINFSTTYGGGTNKVDSADDLKKFLTYLEGLDTKNVFGKITTQAEQNPQTGTTPIKQLKRDAEAALSFITFEHTTGIEQTNTNSNPAIAQQLKSFVIEMWISDPDFRDLIEAIKAKHPTYTLELATLKSSSGGMATLDGNYASVNQYIFDNAITKPNKAFGYKVGAIPNELTNRQVLNIAVIHEMLHTLGLGHINAEHALGVPSSEKAIFDYEVQGLGADNIYYNAFDGDDSGYTKADYTFT